MGYGKYLVFRIINALIILIIATFIMSALFVKVTIDQNKANFQEQMMNWERTTGNKIRQQSGEAAYEQAKKEIEKKLREQYNLDKGYWSQVISKTISTLKLDFGKTQTPIWGTNDVRKII